MRNDKERQAFVQDANNWHEVGTEIMGRVRLRKLEYKNHTWYRIEIMTDCYETEWTATGYKRKKTIRRQPLRMYVIDKETGAFDEPVSMTQIVEKIKEIDKKEKKGGKNNGKD